MQRVEAEIAVSVSDLKKILLPWSMARGAIRSRS